MESSVKDLLSGVARNGCLFEENGYTTQWSVDSGPGQVFDNFSLELPRLYFV
jgi:hypothetical protein